MSQFFVNSSAAPIPVTVVETLTANDASVATAVANNINVLGNNTANNGFATYTNNAGAGVFHVNSYGTSTWVVNPIAGVGTHQTIQSAINSSVAGNSIFITPGTYTENPVLIAGITLFSYDANGEEASAIIIGKVQASYIGKTTLSGIQIKTNGDYAVSITGANQTYLYLENCYLIGTNFSIYSCTGTGNSQRLWFYRCHFDLQSLGINYINNNAGQCKLFYCLLENNAVSLTSNQVYNSATIELFHTFADFFVVTTNNSALFGSDSSEVASITHNSTGPASVSNSIVSGAIQIGLGALLTIENSILSAQGTSVSGSGTIQYGGVVFDSSSLMTIAKQVLLVSSNDCIRVTVPASYPYTVLGSDALISVNTSTNANQINLPASPSAGEKHIVKDTSANASVHNITVSGNGNNIVGTTSAATQVISLNGAAVTYVWSSVESLWLAC